jgi:hypothetical protein
MATFCLFFLDCLAVKHIIKIAFDWGQKAREKEKGMREKPRLKSIVICAMTLFLSSACALAGTWETLDYPGSADTWMEGAGNGYICGYSYSGGFTYDGTTWRTYNHNWPGYRVPIVTGAWGNTIVGWTQETSGDESVHGFLYDGTTWEILDMPGAENTTISGTNGSLFAGEYFVSETGFHGFTYDGTNWTTFDKPGAYIIRVNGISGNDIFGRVDTSGFIYDGTTWETLDMPGAALTEIRGISGNYIVGNYDNPINVSHGFIYDGTTWTTLDMPWSNGLNSAIAGITGDTVVGWYNADTLGNRHGAVYTIPEPATLFLLGLGAVILRKRKK